MADIKVQTKQDELAVGVVQALARQDGAEALELCHSLESALGDQPQLRARLAAWTAQAHLLRGELAQAKTMINNAIALATIAGEPEAISALRGLKADIIRGKAAGASATPVPLPDTLLGQACTALDDGRQKEGLHLARQARIEAQSMGNARDEVLSLLALARIPGQEDSAIRAAHEVADASNDKNLVTAVARAGKAANVPLLNKVF
jgi:hypothetical protein